MKKTAVVLAMLVLLAGAASAIKIGVVIDDGAGNIETKCYDTDDGEKADFVCSKSAFSCSTHPTWGASICQISGTGCPSSNCFCGGWDFWNFNILSGSSWSQSGVGVSFVDVKDGDVLGFAWGAWGEAPAQSPDFCEICGCEGGRGKRIPKVMGYNVTPETGECINEESGIVVNLFDNKTNKPIKGATVEIFEGTPGISAPVGSCETTKDGVAQFKLGKGSYKMRVSGTVYPQEYIPLEVLKATTTTTSSTTTTMMETTTTALTTTTTEYVPPKHIMTEPQKKQKKPKVVGNAISPVKSAVEIKKMKEIQPKKEEPKGALDWLWNLLGF